MVIFKKCAPLLLFTFCLCATATAQDDFQYEQSELSQEASFKEGKPALYKYVTERIQETLTADSKEEMGNKRYLITFDIERNGRISDLHCYPKEIEPMFKIVLDDMYNTSLWNAGALNGEVVRSTYLFPIQIKIK
jgi:alpha-D-ribose 1-methylphosphonate 5-phosphate C-P lyase